jgi:hypothetical protein
MLTVNELSANGIPRTRAECRRGVDFDRLGRGSYKPISDPQQVFPLAKFALKAGIIGDLESGSRCRRLGNKKSPALQAGLFGCISSLPSFSRSHGGDQGSNCGVCCRGQRSGRIPALGWVCIVDRIRGGLSEFGGDFDGRLGTTVVLHAGEKRRVVFLATGLLDRVSGGYCPCFREQRIVIFVAITGV